MKIGEINRLWIKALEPTLGTREATAVTREALGHFANVSPVDIVLKADNEVSATTATELENALKKIVAGCPIQYITGEAWFNGLKLKVDSSVLIPRPETSQLTDIIIKQNSNRTDLKVIDLCTGSGAIAIALARSLPFAEVTGVELSDKALNVAANNGKDLKVSIRWLVADVLGTSTLPDGSYDIVVSNPPYIPENEIAEVDKNVLDYEPHMALFVPDDNPIVFYKAIASWAISHLTEGGSLYFEINPHYSMDIESELKKVGFMDVSILKDSYGKNRFITAHK